jgi:hypothetical protein
VPDMTAVLLLVPVPLTETTPGGEADAIDHV